MGVYLFFENQQEITTLTVIWARQLVSQPSAERTNVAGAGRSRQREPAPTDEFGAVGRPCGETSELAIAVLHGALKVGLADKPEVDTLDDP